MLDHYTVSPSQSMMFIQQIVFKIQCKITRPWNIGHSDLQLFWGQTLGHTDSYSQSILFMHQRVFKAKSLVYDPIYFEVKYWVIPTHNPKVHQSKKVKQVIYTLDTICEPNIMILVQAVLQIFCSQVPYVYHGKVEKGSKKGHNSATAIPTEKNNIWVHLYFMLIPYIKFQDPVS